MSNTLLFNDGILRDFLDNRKREMFDEIESQNDNYILNVNFTDFCTFLMNKYKLNAPSLIEEHISVDHEEVDIDVSRDPGRFIINRNRPLYINGTKIIYSIPFNGDAELFGLQPSSYTLSPPIGYIDRQELYIILECVDQKADDIKFEFNRQLTEIKKYLEWISSDVKQYNESLLKEIELKVTARKEKLLKDRGLVASLGFPLKKRNDMPNTYSVSEIRRKLIPQPTATTNAFTPEPALSIEEYEHILRVVNNMTLVMERSPKAFQTMKEEDIRQHFLVQLNGQYEGQATGETFNFEGKTDILIRVNGKNIFIAECKFWKGAESLNDTIDQILKYLSWRDTKTAIFLFNRMKNLTKVLEQIPNIVKAHQNFRQQLDLKSETEFRFILHHKDDKNRELYLSIMVFEVPS